MKSYFTKKGHLILLLNYLGRLIAAVNTFILLPTFLGLADIGLYAGIHHMVFFFARFNLGQSIIRYGTPFQSDRQAKAAFLGWIWLSSTVGYMATIALFYLFKAPLVAFFSLKTAELADYTFLTVWIGYIVLLNVILKSWAIALDRVVWPSFFQHVVHNLFFAVLITLYGRGYLSFEQLLIGTAIPYTVNLLLLLLELWYRGELRIGYDARIFNRDFICLFLQYSFFTLLSSSMAMLMLRIDNIMVVSMCGKETEGMYHTMTFMVLLLEIPMKVVKQTRAGRVVQLFEQGDNGRLHSLYQSTTCWQFASTGLCFLLLYTWFDYLLGAFSPQAIEQMKWLFLLLGIAKLFDTLFRMGSEILLLSPYFVWATVSALLVLLGTLGNYYLIYAIGVEGAPIATVLTLVIGGTISSYVLWRKLGLHPFSWQLLAWVAAVSALFTLFYVFPAHPIPWVNTSMRTFCIFALYQTMHRIIPET
ncbi:MAG: hypothetical protein AAF335_02120 [Bacteroidota bacterium]